MEISQIRLEIPGASKDLRKGYRSGLRQNPGIMHLTLSNPGGLPGHKTGPPLEFHIQQDLWHGLPKFDGHVRSAEELAPCSERRRRAVDRRASAPR